MAEHFSNCALTSVATACNSSQTTIHLTSTAAPFPATGNFRLAVSTSGVVEIMLVTANNTGTNTLTVTRGVEGTSAAAHSVADPAGAVLTSGSLALFPVGGDLQGTVGQSFVTAIRGSGGSGSLVTVTSELSPDPDDSVLLGDTQNRWQSVASSNYLTYLNQGDTTPSMSLSSAHLAFGDGGSSPSNIAINYIGGGSLTISDAAGTDYYLISATEIAPASLQVLGDYNVPWGGVVSMGYEAMVNAGDTFSAMSLQVDSLSFGPGTAPVDTSIDYGGEGTISVNDATHGPVFGVYPGAASCFSQGGGSIGLGFFGVGYQYWAAGVYDLTVGDYLLTSVDLNFGSACFTGQLQNNVTVSFPTTGSYFGGTYFLDFTQVDMNGFNVTIKMNGNAHSTPIDVSNQTSIVHMFLAANGLPYMSIFIP